jgi:hypothetical protein
VPREPRASSDDIADLMRSVFGDDPELAAEATRIEQLVATGKIEDAHIALSHLAFERVGGRRNGIDVAIARAALALATFHAKREEREEVERLADMFGATFGAWDKRAVPLIDAIKKLAR